MNVLKKRGIYLSVSAVLFVSSILLIFIPKLNLGIDMTGGTQTEYQYANSINIDEVRNSLEEASKSITFEEKEVINSVSVYKISGVQELTVVS
jgi:preprotein translocase subunit SecF